MQTACNRFLQHTKEMVEAVADKDADAEADTEEEMAEGTIVMAEVKAKVKEGLCSTELMSVTPQGASMMKSGKLCNQTVVSIVCISNAKGFMDVVKVKGLILLGGKRVVQLDKL